MANAEERVVEKIQLVFDNGDIETVEKGFVASVEKKTENGEEVANIVAHMVDWSDNDMALMVVAVVELAQKLELFTDDEKVKEDAEHETVTANAR